MTTVSLKIRCRIAELPALGDFLLSSMQAGLADFTAFSPKYDAGFIIAAQAKLDTVEALVNPKQLTAELKVITKRMYENMHLLRGKINFLEGYINRASGLTIDKKDFGIKDVRTRNNKGDIEGLVGAFAYLMGNVSNNMAALTAEGYKPGLHAELTGIVADLKADNTAQNDKMNQRNNNVTANYGVLNDFWYLIMDVSDAGRRIYKVVAPNKVDDFTMSTLKDRIRQERNNTKMSGRVMSANAPVNGAKVAMKPLMGGRNRTAYSKASGEYAISSMEPGDYEVTVSAAGKGSEISVVTIATNVPVVKDFELI